MWTSLPKIYEAILQNLYKISIKIKLEEIKGWLDLNQQLNVSKTTALTKLATTQKF